MPDPTLPTAMLRRSLLALAIALAASASAQTPPAWVPLNASSSTYSVPSVSAVDASGTVYVIQLPAGGGFFSPLELARWDGTAWAVLPGTPPLADRLRATRAGDALYAINSSSSAALRYDVSAGTWTVLANGPDGQILGMDTDGAGNLVVVGRFTQTTGGLAVRHIARWNQAAGRWEAVGGGLDADGRAVTVEPSGAIVVAGEFDQTFDTPTSAGQAAGGAARFDPTTGWIALGTGFDAGRSNRPIFDMVSDGTNVTVLGSTVRLAGTTRSVWRWDGTQWSPYARANEINLNPRQLAQDGAGTIYAIGGTFLGGGLAGNFTVHARGPNDFQWTLIASNTAGNTFSTVAANPNHPGQDLFLGGRFFGLDTPLGWNGAINAARWNGSAWTEYALPFVGTNGEVYAAEEVIRVPAPSASLTAQVTRQLVVGGNLTEVAGTPVNKVAMYDGLAWTGLGRGVTSSGGVVRAILRPPLDRTQNGSRQSSWRLPTPTPLVVGGTFREVTNGNGVAVPVSNVAEWDLDAQRWESLGGGVSVGGVPGSGVVHALAHYPGCVVLPGSDDPYVYVGGEFDTATNPNGSTVAVRNLARYNLATRQWSAVEGGINGPVYALDVIPYLIGGVPRTDPVMDHHALVVGGNFGGALDANGTLVANTGTLAWITSDGAWRSLGHGVDGPVYALDAVSDYVFASSGSSPWNVCGEDTSPEVYVGGAFANALSAGGSIPASNLVKATFFSSGGIRWEPLGTPTANGVDGPVSSIRVIDELTDPYGLTTLVVGGTFANATGTDGQAVPARNLALLRETRVRRSSRDDIEFREIDGGADASVLTTAWTSCRQTRRTLTSTHYVGGAFTEVGNGIASPGLAKWRDFLPPPPVQVTHVARSSKPRRPCTGSNGCGRSIAVGPLWQISCPGPSLGRTARRGTNDDPIDLGTGVFGETLPALDVDLSPGAPLAFEMRDEDGMLVGVDTVVVDRIGPVTFILSGIEDDEGYAPNPDGRSTALSVTPVQMPLRDRRPGGQGWIRVFHAATDAPAVDLELANGTVLADSVVFDSLGVGVAVPLGPSSVEVRRHDDGTLLSTLQLDLPADDPVQIVVLAGFVDPSANPDGIPLQLIQVPMREAVPVADAPDALTSSTALGPPTPNPTRGRTRIPFQTPDGPARLDVFDALGRHVATLHDGPLPAGTHDALWDASNLPSGVYLIRLRAGDVQAVRRVTHVR